MEVKIQRTAFYFSWSDDEILDEKTLNVTGDDETWLYRVERGSYNGHFQTPTQPNHHHAPSGSVDSRTFTRRKHTLRPSLESVAESPLSNRSSLGILSASHLNDTKLMDCSTTPISRNQGRTSSNFTAFDKALVPRIFKLNTPFTNYPLERKRHDSEVSDISILPSLDSQFDKTESMTDSLVNFLEKPYEKCQPSDNFENDKPMTESLVSLSEKGNGFEFDGEPMTDSMVNFLEPMACKPPSGFQDEEMGNSIVNIDEKDVLPASDMTNSLMDYLNSVDIRTSSLTQNTASNEAENIPPVNLSKGIEIYSNSVHKDRLRSVVDVVNSTFEIENGGGTLNVEDSSKISPNITFTNSVNITRTKKEIRADEDDCCITRPVNCTFEKESNVPIDYESNLKSRALNNKDLNVAQDLSNEDDNDFISSKYCIPSKTNLTKNNSKMNGTFTKSDLSNSTLNMSRQIPKRNSTFNTTFTKLNSETNDLSRTYSKLPTHTLRGLNCTFTRSTDGLSGGIEDDQTSSASDSSFSSGSTKPRSVDELRTIAQQQECNLVQSSTPTEETREVAKHLAKLDLELSPIRRDSLEKMRRYTESRSTHCSPVRSHHPRSPLPHPITQLKQPLIEARRQTLQASSLSNLTRPRTTGSRMPQPLSRVSMLVRPESRPSSVPAPPAPTGIPRPQASRLPMPRARASGIPTAKRGRH